jgi:hypothetical protein
MYPTVSCFVFGQVLPLALVVAILLAGLYGSFLWQYPPPRSEYHTVARKSNIHRLLNNTFSPTARYIPFTTGGTYKESSSTV